jgi:hypothetical protein
MRVRLIHWRPVEAASRADTLEKLGFEAESGPFSMDILKAMGEEPPGAVIVDLTRIPSQGRDIGVAIRKRRSTRHIPIVFAGGDKEKVEAIKVLLPDAVYSSWDKIGEALEMAAARPVEDPVVPSSTFAAYAGKPLAVKLGISRGRVILLGAPEGFESDLGDLPDDVRISRRAGGKGRTVMLFASSMSDLQKRLLKAKSLMEEGGSLWVAWRKKSSGKGSDLTQASVRRFGLDSGLVDYKVCSIDGTWSGLRFAVRDKRLG